jgi:transcriptional regulator with XRE-family HTH domain
VPRLLGGPAGRNVHAAARSYCLAAGLNRKDVEQDAGLSLERLKEFEDKATKPQLGTRARLAKVLGAPELERFREGA